MPVDEERDKKPEWRRRSKIKGSRKRSVIVMTGKYMTPDREMYKTSYYLNCSKLSDYYSSPPFHP